MCEHCHYRFPRLAERSRSWANAASLGVTAEVAATDPAAAQRAERARQRADAIYTELHPTPLEQSRCWNCGDLTGVRCCEFGRDR
jgi:hypothetical protein